MCYSTYCYILIVKITHYLQLRSPVARRGLKHKKRKRTEQIEVFLTMCITNRQLHTISSRFWGAKRIGNRQRVTTSNYINQHKPQRIMLKNDVISRMLNLEEKKKMLSLESLDAKLKNGVLSRMLELENDVISTMLELEKLLSLEC
ncbi:hypothetical protein GDO86_011954 [Hymenochirus boettgeri]|uniref:Uncharacterized protein n=1 Tax=Hymenochirus boettgeri TaxID=247094 RepID=A0A8T2JGB5_9PIPI|nr:hypothetical protein GDO86_011954 [Hymenochirus boettgeri]